MTKRFWLTSMLMILVVSVLAACGSKDNAGGSPGSGGSSSGGDSGGTKEITVAASNFKFEPSEIRVKKGQKVKITLDNKEGMHGLAIPEFNVDLKKPGSAEFTADKAGTFEFHCSVVCGAGHAEMKGKLIVE
ncbi:cupredoxin domain-containing protein [Paenibacillus sp. CC-CFT747]|nr:cupredoxin domain-containing protein [Paenibacillus sp. CC-CFT747]